MATKDTRPAKLDDTDAPTGRHRPLALSEAPRSIDDDVDDVDDDDDSISALPRRARRRPRPEHVSTPPSFAAASDDDDDDVGPRTTAPERTVKQGPARQKRPGTKGGKGKSAAKKTTSSSTGLRDSLPLEITGVVVFAANVLLLLSLLSYAPADGQPGHPVENWIGPGGAVVADLLTIACGAMAFALPVFVMALVVACFRPIERPRHAALRTLSGAGASLSLMSLMHLVFRGTQVMPFPAGGLVGALIADAGSRVLAPLGTGIVAVAGAFVGIVVALDRPLGGTTRSILDRLVDTWHAATEQLHVWREERRLVAEEHERLELELELGRDESLPMTPAVELAEDARRQVRLEKADARQKRIMDKARTRAMQRLDDESAERHEDARHATTTDDDEVAPSPVPVHNVVTSRKAPMVTGREARLPALPVVGEPVATPQPGAAVADATVVPPSAADEPTFESATVVQTDPPWARAIDDGSVVSLADAMARRHKALQPEILQPVPSMILDDELKIIEREADAATLVAEAERMDEVKHHVQTQVAAKREFMLPPLNLLDYDAPVLEPLDEGKLRAQADKLVAKFMDFGIEGRVREIRPGPVVTTYEFVPAPGIKVSKISALSDDIAMAMEAVHVRIVAPIPGKGAVGIEIPNEKRETVYMKEIIADPQFKKRDEKLMMALGKDIEGKSYYANLADMPHVLISGTTGSGKSVSVNAMICSILYRSTPEDVRFMMMIDPKMLELSIYDGIPHLLLPPIIDSKKAAVALKWCVAEMERRYQLLSDMGVRDLKGFNDRVLEADANEPGGGVKTGLFDKDGKRLGKMPFIVVIIDEYADLIAVAGKDVEGYVMRIAQKARAAGIHVMLATQRPSVDVITGVIKANFPVRMGFRLASNHDSKTIINQPGAEKLLGRGDMLFMPPGTSNVLRVHGAFISEKELHRVVDFLKQQGKPDYNMDILTYQDDGDDEGGSVEDFSNEPRDARYDEAIALVARTKKCSTSFVQRMLNIGYQRAARIVDRMEREGMVGAALNTKGDREIYLRPDGSVDSSQRVNM